MGMPCMPKPCRGVVLIRIFVDNEAAFAFVEQRRWRFGRTCPRCGAEERFGELRKAVDASGQYKCYACRSFFTIRSGTILEGSHLQFDTWLAALFLMVASQGTISLTLLAELLGVTVQTATKLKRLLAPEARVCAIDAHEIEIDRSIGARFAGIAARLPTKCCQETSGESPRQIRIRKLLALIEALSSDDIDLAFDTALERHLFARKPVCVGEAGSTVLGKTDHSSGFSLGRDRYR
jgi:transposase-like protein